MINKFVHTADVHIKSKGDEGFHALEEILGKAKENKAAALFITGDLFESDKASFSTRTKVKELFESYQEIKVFLIKGNHDEESYSKNINYGENVIILSDEPFEKVEFDGMTVYGVPFRRGSNLTPALKEVSSDIKDREHFNILLTHGTLIDQWLRDILIYMKDYEKDTDSFYIHADEFTGSPVNLVLLGHYHKFTEKNYGGTLVTYAGSPIATNLKNAGPRRASLIEVDSQRNVKISPVMLASAYVISEIFKAVPGKEQELVENIGHFALKNKDGNANLDIKIEGYINTDENEFSSKIKDLENSISRDFKSVNVKNSSRQVRSIKENALAGQFLKFWEEKFKNASTTPEEQEVYHRALEFALDAFEESILKKK